MPMAVALLGTCLVILVLSSVVWLHDRRRPLRLPPGPRGWPVFGSMGLLAGELPPHRVLAKLAARHGPLMHLRLVSFDAVVASSAETARLVLKTHDVAFADRPPTAAGAIVSYGYKGILLTPSSPYLLMARKLCATELFSPRRVASFEQMRALARGLLESSGAAVVVREHLASFTMRNILRMAVGDKWLRLYGSDEGEAFRRALDEAFAVAGAVSSIAEWVPWLGRLVDVQGLTRRMKRVHERLDQFLEEILDEHEKHRRRRLCAIDVDGGELAATDLVDVLLQLAEEGNSGSDDRPAEGAEARITRDGVKAFVQDIIGGGTKTAAATMEWALTELLRRPDAMAATTAELDRVVGRGRWVTERDLPALPYLDAVVKETMRLHPPAPLLVPRRAREDTVVLGGYDVPAGARVLVNVWAVARDPASWPDAPEAFRPERFLPGGGAEGVDVRGAHFQLLPFGAGRRMCPAYNLAIKEVAAALANLVHGFAWRLPDGVAPEDVSMDEFLGLTMSMKVPLVAVVQPRLPEHLYADVD